MASEQDLQQADLRARQAARTEFENPLVLQAGAGTGKTTTLVGRLLTWCLGPGWTASSEEEPDAIAREVLSGVVALTFTEPAAAEMAKRSAEWLATIAAGRGADIKEFKLEAIRIQAEPPIEERATALLGRLDILTIRTIHSFCHGLLTQNPFSAGVHPRLEIDSDGYHTERLVFEQVESQFPDWARDQPEDLAILARARIGPRSLARGALELLQKGVPAGALDRPWFTRENLQALARRTSAAVGELAAAARPLSQVPKRNTATLRGLDELEATLAILEEATKVAETSRSLALIEEATKLLAELAERGRLKDWSRQKLTKGERDTLTSEEETALAAAAQPVLLLADHLSRLDPEIFRALREALAPILSAVERELRAQGIVTFHDLLELTVSLLRHHGAIRARVRKGLLQLLVDEVQDTDPLQYRIISMLALGKGRRPGLFVVGDPKQSIYGWRQADLRAYEAFLEEIRAAGGKIMELTSNFRSTPGVLGEVSRALRPVMRHDPGVQPSFVELRADRTAEEGELPGGRRAVEYWISWARDPELRFTRTGDPPSNAAAQIEARAIANDLLDLNRESGVRWGECGILLRSRSRFDIYLEALRERSIPFAVSRDTLYYRRREVIDTAALIRLIVDPADELALLTWIRSPFVGVPDAALLPLWRNGFPEATQRLMAPASLGGLTELIVRASTGVDPEAAPQGDLGSWPQQLEHSCWELATLRECFANDPSDRFIERLRVVTQLEVTAAARFQGRHRLANIDRLLRRVETAMEESGGDNQRVLRALRRGVAEAQEEEEARPAVEDGDTVKLLTIHGAKGLEFRFLYAANLGASPRSRRQADWDVAKYPEAGSDGEVVLHGLPSPGWDRINAQRVRSTEAERARTLYVAMTRAADRLVLLGGWHQDGGTKLRERPGADHLSLLAWREGGVPDLATWWQRLEEQGKSDLIDEDGVRWVFPELDPMLSSREGQRKENASPPDAELVREQSQQLAEQRSAAALRMKRPFSGAPSRLAGGGGAPDEVDFAPSSDDREVRETAAELGTRVHHLFESWDLAAEPESELERGRNQLLESIGGGDSKLHRGASELLERLASGNLWRRFAALGDRVLARELPMLLPGEEEGDGPLGYLSGKIDMIYRGDDDALVIVDYKTDRVEGDEAIETRAAQYAPQAEAYRKAITEALALPAPPRFELWFLWPDRVVEL